MSPKLRRPWRSLRSLRFPGLMKTTDNLFDSEFLRRLEVLRVAAGRLFEGAAAGNRAGRRTGPGLEFAEHRAYAAGDDYRYVDWAAYGRLGRLLLRLCRMEEDLSIYFLLDASASMASGQTPKFDHARRLVAALAYVGLASLERVRVVSFGAEVGAHLEAGRGKSHLGGVLDFLRGLRADGPTDLGRAVQTFLPHAPRAGLAILGSDLLDEGGYERPLLALQSRGFDAWCLRVSDPAEAAPPETGDLPLEDAETGRRLGVHLTREVRERLVAATARFAADARAWCHERGIGYAEAPTDTPVDALILEVLRRGGLLA